MSLRQVPLADGDPCWVSLAPFLTPSLVPGICDPHGLGSVFLQVVPGWSQGGVEPVSPQPPRALLLGWAPQ